jgi:hypothetical protein
MPDFNTPEEFRKSVASGRIHGKRSGIFVHFYSVWARLKSKTQKKV